MPGHVEKKKIRWFRIIPMQYNFLFSDIFHWLYFLKIIGNSSCSNESPVSPGADPNRRDHYIHTPSSLLDEKHSLVRWVTTRFTCLIISFIPFSSPLEQSWHWNNEPHTEIQSGNYFSSMWKLSIKVNIKRLQMIFNALFEYF